MWKFRLNAGKSSNTADVYDSGAVRVANETPPPPLVGSENKIRYFSQLVSSNGDGTGTTNMNVDGSVTTQEFSIDSVEDYDIHINHFIIFIGDTQVTHGNFGNVGALGTGWDLCVKESGEDTFLIDKATTGGEVIIQSATDLAWGDGNTSFELSNYSGTNDATLVHYPVHQIIPGGVRIGRGTRDQIISVVNDDLTGLVDFTVRGLGYKHFP